MGINIGWNFPNNNNGEFIGIGEAGIETFKGSLFSSLAREICQNSLDARVDDKKPVKIEFVLNDIDRKSIYGIDDLSNAVLYCRDYWKENNKTYNFFNNAVKVIKKPTIRVMRISDYNTTGLTGSDKIKSSPWQDLVKSSGVSNKGGELGGSFGIGKSAPFACSDLRTIFYNTLDINGLKAFQGVAKLVSFQYPDKHGLLKITKGSITQGKGYYGKMADNSAVEDLIDIDGFKRTVPGTDVFIIGFLNHSEWKKEVIKAVIDGYLISILQNSLEIKVDNIDINSKTINDIIELYKEEIPLAYNYFQVLNNKNTVTICEDFEGLGNFELKVLIQKNFKRKVLMARNNGMKIFDKGNISGTVEFAAVCLLKDKDINEYFRKMENPQHNNWEPDRVSDNEKEKKLADKRKRALFKLIKTKITDIGKSTVLDEMDAVGAGEFIPDVDTSSGTDMNKSESINNEIKDYTPLEKSKSIKIEEGSQISENPDINTEGLDFGEENPEGDFPVPEYKHEDADGGQVVNGGNGNNDAIGQMSDEGNLPVHKTISIQPLKLRLFMLNSKDKIYKLSFIPNKSAQNAYIEISISGEQSSNTVEIKDASTDKGKALIHNKNKIYIGNIKENQRYSLLYSIKYNELCSMGVVVHGYKI